MLHLNTRSREKKPIIFQNVNDCYLCSFKKLMRFKALILCLHATYSPPHAILGKQEHLYAYWLLPCQILVLFLFYVETRTYFSYI